MRKLLELLFGKRKPVLKVALVLHNGNTKIVEAFNSQSGLMAQAYQLNDCWCLLKPDYSVIGPCYVNGWYKVSGFPLEEKVVNESI